MRTDLRRLCAAAALPFAFLLLTGLAGIDFGKYWDDESMFEKVRHALHDPPTLLPGAYDYPSMTFWIALTGIVPEAAASPEIRHVHPDTTGLLATTATRQFLLRERAIFLAVTSLVVFWTAGLSLAAGGSLIEAFLAAAAIATSWEVGYHARWVAPDGTLMMFGALMMFAAVAALRIAGRGHRAWLTLATVATGLACGTKYSAWPLVIPLALVAWETTPDHSAEPARGSARARRAFLVLASAVGAYLVTTPGTLLQPTLFGSGIHYQLRHYATGHGLYTIARGPEHVVRLLTYLSASLLSPYTPVAIALAALAAAGTAALWRADRRLAIVVLVFPAFYILYMSAQRVMIVRNLMVLAPFIAVLSARGTVATAAFVRARVGQFAGAAVLAAVVAGLLANASFDVAAARSIRAFSTERMVVQFADWFRAQPAGTVALTPHARAALASVGVSAPTTDPTQVRYLAFFAFDGPVSTLRANRRGVFAADFGPRDVNMDCYPDWVGQDRILVLANDTR